MTTEAYSLYQVNEYLKRTIALNFPNQIWVQAEIAQIRESRGHWYIELVEKSEGQEDIIAQSSAVIWRNTYAQLFAKIGPDLKGILSDGMEVMVKCQLSYHERYGLKLTISDVQPEFTIGKLARERAATIAKLKALNLMDANKSLEAPIVIQKIAVISSTTAAGFQDFQRQLEENPLGYQFKVDLFPSAMQGLNTEPEVLTQLAHIVKRGGYDVITIIRGGGAKLDLVAFDSLAISVAIAKLKIPVLIGIGHDIDESVVDMVAYRSLKTPTAVADYIIAANQVFEENILRLYDELKAETIHQLQQENDQLIRQEEFIRLTVPNKLLENRLTLERKKDFLQIHLPQQLSAENLRLDYLIRGFLPLLKSQLNKFTAGLEAKEAQINLLSPDATLARGYSISLINGKSLSKDNLPKAGKELITLSRVGKVISKIENYEQGKK